MELRRSRSDGFVRTPVQQMLTAVAITLVRSDAALTHTARGTTRRSMRKRALAFGNGVVLVSPCGSTRLDPAA